MRDRLKSRLEISPERYAQVTMVALAALSLIVLTGAGVRLTGSGLGCPDWPKCYGGTTPPIEFHAVIEYGNRLLTGFVGFAVIAASVLAFFRRPYRWHLALFGALLPLGVIGQAVLGALVVKYHLAPGLVMSHFILSMMLLDAAFALAWCSRYEPWERRRSRDRLSVWTVRALIPLGQLTILAGTIATASGPHAGAHEGQLVHRFDFEGTGTLEWVVQRHAAIAAVYGIAAIAVWFLLRRPGADARALRPLTLVIALLGLQGAIGGLQWALELPAGIVWVHVAIATGNWLAMLWTVAAAGRLEPREGAEAAPVEQPERPAAAAAGTLSGLLQVSRPFLALLVIPLFAIAWARQDALSGETAALALSALACVSLGWLTACVVPPRWLTLAIYVMAAIDAWLIASDLLQEPNAILNAAAPAADLPRLQYASFGSAVMGFGDLFIAATLGALLASDRRLQLQGAALAAVICPAFDLLFFFVDQTPATVPIALTLATLDLLQRARPRQLRT